LGRAAQHPAGANCAAPHVREIVRRIIVFRGINRSVDVCASRTRQNAGEERVMPPVRKPKAYYLKLGAGRDQVVGTSRDRYHVGWIKLRSLYQETPGFGAGGGRGKATVTEFLLSKLEDRTSSEMFLAASGGRTFKSAAIEVADPETGIPQFRMNFTDVVLGGFKADPDVSIGEAGPIEEFRLNFANVEFNYNPIAEESVGDILQSIFKNLGLAPAQ
jgi:type VI protein secretion system component Hcp